MHTKQKQKKSKYEKLKVISLEFMVGGENKMYCGCKWQWISCTEPFSKVNGTLAKQMTRREILKENSAGIDGVQDSSVGLSRHFPHIPGYLIVEAEKCYNVSKVRQ